VYFYRQVKNYIAKFQNFPLLIAAKHELSSREDCMEMHALILNQLQASIYTNMIRYAWYATKLISSEVFCMAKVQTANASAASKHLLDVHGVANFCVFIAFMSTIRNPASLCLKLF
jgi:hypothetical protein